MFPRLIPVVKPDAPTPYPISWHATWRQNHAGSADLNVLRYLAKMAPIGSRRPQLTTFRTPWVYIKKIEDMRMF